MRDVGIWLLSVIVVGNGATLFVVFMSLWVVCLLGVGCMQWKVEWAKSKLY
jgi:hypothetical protein